MNARDVTVLTRQLATLLHSGVELVSALDILARSREGGAMSRIARTLAADVRSGHAFAAALTVHSARGTRSTGGFDDIYCQLVAAGEMSGTLAQQLARLAEHRERSQKMRETLRAALIYPCSVLLVALAVIAALLTCVVPEFERLFSGMGAPLPPITRTVVSLSRAALTHGMSTLGYLTLISLVMTYWIKRSAAARLTRDRWYLGLPIAGPVLRHAAAARWARTLGTLVEAGVPLPDAMDAAAAVCGNAAMYHAGWMVQRAVGRGASLGAALEADGHFPELVAQMAAVGEESGTLGRMLNKAADLLDDDVAQRLTAFSGMLEPMMITGLGLIVGGIVLAMYLPMLQLGHVTT